jgi:hypothetical protein
MGANGTGARLTNLNVAGQVNIGDVVVVDYSARTPYVRPIQSSFAEESMLEPLTIPLELTKDGQDDICDPFSLPVGEVCGTLAKITHPTSFGVPLYTSGGSFYAADANTISTAKVIALGTGSDIVLLDGWAKGSWSFSSGEYIFLAVGGGMSQSLPTETDQCVVVLGVALTSDIIRFKPELVIVELL